MRRIRLIGALVVALLVIGARPVLAAWSDAEVGQATFTAGRIVAPIETTCNGGLLGGATFNWSQPTGGVALSGYRVTILRGSTVQATGMLSGDARSFSTGSLLSTVLGGVTYTVRIQAVAGTWTAAEMTGTFSVGLLGGFSTCSW